MAEWVWYPFISSTRASAYFTQTMGRDLNVTCPRNDTPGRIHHVTYRNSLTYLSLISLCEAISRNLFQSLVMTNADLSAKKFETAAWICIRPGIFLSERRFIHRCCEVCIASNNRCFENLKNLRLILVHVAAISCTASYCKIVIHIWIFKSLFLYLWLYIILNLYHTYDPANFSLRSSSCLFYLS